MNLIENEIQLESDWLPHLLNKEDKELSVPPKSGGRYNLGDKLLMPPFSSANNFSNGGRMSRRVDRERALQHEKVIAPYYWGNICARVCPKHHQPSWLCECNDQFPNSIWDHYCTIREPNEEIPNTKTLCDAVDKYIANNPIEELLDLVKGQDTLCVHVRTGDMGVISESYLDCIDDLLTGFSSCVIILGLHWALSSPERIKKHGNLDQIYLNFKKTMSALLRVSPKIKISMASADEHVCMMKKSKNLLVHRAGYSMIGTLICEGNLFVTKDLNPSQRWVEVMSCLNKKYELVKPNKAEFRYLGSGFEEGK